MTQIKNAIQSSNINFLFGSGLSSPYLKTLGEVEIRLTELDRDDLISQDLKDIIRASIRKSYLDRCISGNVPLIENHDDSLPILSLYKKWLILLNRIILKRKSTLLNKQVNLFTTNMDIFTEIALEGIGAEFNDGFYGSLKPTYDLSNFKKSISKTSQQYGIASELPLFNLFKLHGSVNWGSNLNKKILMDVDLKNLRQVVDIQFEENLLIDIFIPGTNNIKSHSQLVTEAQSKPTSDTITQFNNLYDKLNIINPTKEKFKSTTLDGTYYELLRMYANELERENSILFVMGFSFADEHIKEITLRSVRSNPTLKIYILGYDSAAENVIKENLGLIADTSLYPNIEFIGRKHILNSRGEMGDEYPHNLENICKFIFQDLLEDAA